MSNFRHKPPHYRPSFTLVELLITVSVIAFMSSLLLFTLLGAQNDARRAKTRSTISKINEVILQRWEEYRYRPIRTWADSVVPNSAPGVRPLLTPNESARLRMLALRDTMRMEMPDRITDILYGPSQYTIAFGTTAAKVPRAVPNSFGLIYNKLRSNLQASSHAASFQLIDIDALPYANPQPATAAVSRFAVAGSDAAWTSTVQSSEMLYLIVSASQFSGSSALEHFSPSEVGDTDNDGLLEFIDGWDNAIQWIRWPAGYSSDLVRYADDDAMDPLKTDWRYRPGVANDWHPRTLVPLIVSPGPDGLLGLQFDDPINGPAVYATMTWPTGQLPYGTVGPSSVNQHYAAGPYFVIDPFFTFDGAVPGPHALPGNYRRNQIGSVNNPQIATDNVTNHDILLEP